MNDHKPAVLVAGASSGIGESCVLHLAKQGYRVFAGVRREADAHRLSAQGHESIVPVILEVTDPESIAQARETMEHDLGAKGLAGLVNNAGIISPGPLEYQPMDAMRRIVEVNLTGLMAITQVFLSLIRRTRGRIVNMGSIQSRQGIPFFAAYSATKSALVGLTEALRLELRPWGIEVILIEPGSIATPIWDKGFAALDQLADNLPPEGRELYGEYSKAFRKALTEVSRQGIPPDKVAKVVGHALSARRPRTRYLIGRDARLFALMAWLVPDRLRDGIFTKMTHLPSAGSLNANVT